MHDKLRGRCLNAQVVCKVLKKNTVDLLKIAALGKIGWKSELPEIGPVGLQPASSFKFSCFCAPIALRCFVLKRITLLTVDLSSRLKNVPFLKVDHFILRDENKTSQHFTNPS